MVANRDRVSLIGAIGIGIGGMVGGGIFAVLGLSISISKGGTPLAFALAGLIALITSYSYAKLSAAYPGSGGTVIFMNKGFGRGVFSGGTNNLLWFSYIVMLSLYASAFGSYAKTLYSITGNASLDQHLYETAIIVLATIINYYSIKIVSNIETWAVGIKMIVLLLFVGVGLYGLSFSDHLDQLGFQHWPDIWSLSIGGMVIFVAYEGMELIANVSGNMVHAKKNMMPAYMISTGIVVTLYVVIAVITVGSLSFADMIRAEDYVLAEAAKPVLGEIGFTVIAIAALISTFSAINATIYGGSKVNYELAIDDELPHEFTKIFWNQPIGLFVTSVLTLVIVNLFDLSSISTSGSAGFLLIFMLVNLVAFLRRKEIQGSTLFPVIGVVFCGAAYLGLLFQQWSSNRIGALFAIGIALASYMMEFIYKSMENRTKVS